MFAVARSGGRRFAPSALRFVGQVSNLPHGILRRPLVPMTMA